MKISGGYKEQPSASLLSQVIREICFFFNIEYIGFFFMAFFGCGFWDYHRLFCTLFSCFSLVHRFFFIAFFQLKKPYCFFLLHSIFFIVQSIIAFLFLIAFSLSLRKVYRFSIIASDDIKHRRWKKNLFVTDLSEATVVSETLC